MENIQDTESHFINDVKILEAKEALKSICDFYRRFGIDVQRDDTQLMSIAERLGLQ